jgi:hypothetical protein
LTKTKADSWAGVGLRDGLNNQHEDKLTNKLEKTHEKRTLKHIHSSAPDRQHENTLGPIVSSPLVGYGLKPGLATLCASDYLWDIVKYGSRDPFLIFDLFIWSMKV